MRILVSCLLSMLVAVSWTPAFAEWPEGTLGRLMEQCHAFVQLAPQDGRPTNDAQLFDAGYCRAYIEGYITGVIKERYRPGGNFAHQEICMPGTGSTVISMKGVIFYITSKIETMPDSWGKQVGAFPWAIITLDFNCPKDSHK